MPSLGPQYVVCRLGKKANLDSEFAHRIYPSRLVCHGLDVSRLDFRNVCKFVIPKKWRCGKDKKYFVVSASVQEALRKLSDTYWYVGLDNATAEELDEIEVDVQRLPSYLTRENL